ncbi:uncharacterized protein LOC125662160 [Ostrea edulis]|uniref:uncharacterized protein LOC125662160 n=1 Tax=Ostrea edulis TaxID=37623 RepID=UPI0024AFAF1C|nr:uncharacterized protein LOC125662160 [Ostrea edulis]
MAEEMSVPDDLTFKRKRAEAEESIVQIKRPRRESLGGENETTSTSTTEGHSETCGSSEKSYYKSLRPITENPPNTESREDEEPLQEAFTACSSPSKHYKEDIDGSSSENSKETFVSVEIPVHHDEMGLRDESDSVETTCFSTIGEDLLQKIRNKNF